MLAVGFPLIRPLEQPEIQPTFLREFRSDDRLSAGGIGLQEVLEGGHLPPIEISEIGMDPQERPQLCPWGMSYLQPIQGTARRSG